MNSDVGRYRMTVGDVMSTPAVVVADTETFRNIVEKLRTHRISAVPVVSSTGDMIGIVSEADLLLKEEGEVPGELLHPLRHRRLQAKVDKVYAGELMTSPPISVTYDAPVPAAARIMQKAGVKRLPVVDADGTLLGIVTRGDLLKVFLRGDHLIREEVLEGVIKRDMMIDTAGLTVVVDDGIVTLAGEIERASDVERMLRLVNALDGVVSVRSALTFRWDDRVMDPAAASQFAGWR